MDGALSGYRVLDLTDEKGMLCPRLLADMEAEVIRIDKPGSQKIVPIWENLGKRSITLDFETNAGRDIFLRLLKTVDILVESGEPGRLDSLGLGYRDLSRVNRRLIMASITGFGRMGPHRDYESSEIVASAMGGQMYVNGEPGMPPIEPYGSQAYYTACLYAAIGVMLALQSRHSTGRGQHLDISIEECVASALDHVLVRYFYLGEVARRRGSLYWNSAFRVFPCRDGYVLLSLFQNWETLVEWLASEGMAEDLTDSKWLDHQTRLENIEHIISVIERWAKTHIAVELVETGQAMRFPWAKVASIPELLESPQLRVRGFFAEGRDTSGRSFKYPAAPCKMSASSWRVGTELPTPGQDNGRIYSALGFSAEELKALAEEGVI